MSRSGILGFILMLAGLAPAWGGLQAELDAAAPGATILVPAGVHTGPLRVEKPVTLRGEPGAEIRGDGSGSVITIRAAGVCVEGLLVTGSGLDLGRDDAAIFVEGDNAVIRGNTLRESLHGVYLKKVRGVRVEENVIEGKAETIVAPGEVSFQPGGDDNCSTTLDQNRRGNGIHLWNSEKVTLRDNRIGGTRDGIYTSFVYHSHISGNRIERVRFGFHSMYSDGNRIEGNRFTRNAAGVVMMYSRNQVIRRNTIHANVGHRAYGLLLLAVDQSQILENRVAGNSVGLYLELSNGNTILANTVRQGYIGVRLTGSSDANRFSRNRFAGNLHPAEIDGGVGRNQWAIDDVGNYWGATVIDLDGDGIGDRPHRESDLLGRLRRPFPMVALLSGSPGLDLVRFAHHSAPIPRVHAIEDPAPQMSATLP